MSLALKNDSSPQTLAAVWIFSLIFFVFLIVVVGGITRLTESGLSIVEWRPITGVVPPLNELQWQQEFAKYQQYPEFQKMNSHFQLSDFKMIYFWEYLHRLLGRMMGLLFILPWFFFWRQKAFNQNQHGKLLLAFVLGGCQGLLGWYMVKSGLVDRPDVSHFRLAAHLGLALLIMGHLMWMVLDYLSPPALAWGKHPKRWWAMVLLALVAVQIIWGAFTAGLDAGFVYNTYPKMGESWIAAQVFADSPWYLNFIDNPIGIQFVHRWLGTALFFFITFLWIWLGRGELVPRQRLGLNLVAMALTAQVALGILTLIFTVPISLAVVHQAGAVVVLLMVLFFTHAMFRSPQSFGIQLN